MSIDAISGAGAGPPVAARRRIGKSGAFVVPEEPDEGGVTMTTDGLAPLQRPVSLAPLARAADGCAAKAELSAGDAANHGGALLSALAGLQAASLTGTGQGDMMSAQAILADLAQVLPSVASPGLGSVLLAIAQRVAVELARSGRD